MKKLFMFILAISTLSIAVTSCEKDGELTNSEMKNLPDGMTEEGNFIYYKEHFDANYGDSMDYSYEMLYTFEFSNNSCIKATLDYIFASSLMVDAFYMGMQETEYPTEKRGDRITVDITSLYLGYSRDEIRAALNELPEF